MIYPVKSHTVENTAANLKQVLYARGFEVSQPFCMDLAARLYGYENYDDFPESPKPTELSPRDSQCDLATVRRRRQFQTNVLAAAGFGNIAGTILDIVEPNGPREPRTRRDRDIRLSRLMTGM